MLFQLRFAHNNLTFSHYLIYTLYVASHSSVVGSLCFSFSPLLFSFLYIYIWYCIVHIIHILIQYYIRAFGSYVLSCLFVLFAYFFAILFLLFPPYGKHFCLLVLQHTHFYIHIQQVDKLNVRTATADPEKQQNTFTHIPPAKAGAHTKSLKRTS